MTESDVINILAFLYLLYLLCESGCNSQVCHGSFKLGLLTVQCLYSLSEVKCEHYNDNHVKYMYKSSTANGYNIARKYARISVPGHYLFRDANSFPRALLEEN